MDAQELRNLSEAYNQVHQVDEDAGIVSGLVGLALGAKGALHAAKKTKRLRDYPKNFAKGIADPRTYFPKKKKEQQKEQTDLYDIILSHLLDEGYAETPEAAEAIMVNMSEDWREDIVEKSDDTYLEPNWKKRKKNNEKAIKDMKKDPNHQKYLETVRKQFG